MSEIVPGQDMEIVFEGLGVVLNWVRGYPEHDDSQDSES